MLLPAFGSAANASIWPIEKPEAGAPDHHQRDEKLTGHLRIVFLGDSATKGAEATSEATTYRGRALEHLARSLPSMRVTAVTVALGGSTSSDWLGDDPRCDLSRVETASADIVVVEFVNDAGLDGERWQDNYDALTARVTSTKARLLLTTPPFTMRELMGDLEGDGVDRRSYVAFLREYTQPTGLLLADVSRGWSGLRLAGLPYWTLLANGNHPDDRGHELSGRIVGAALVEIARTVLT